MFENMFEKNQNRKEFEKNNNELKTLQATNKSQRNQIESTKMVQKLIEEKNETIKLLASQQSQQANEMEKMRKKVKFIIFIVYYIYCLHLFILFIFV